MASQLISFPVYSPCPFCNSAKQCQKDAQCHSQHSYWWNNKPSKLAGSSGEAVAVQASKKSGGWDHAWWIVWLEIDWGLNDDCLHWLEPRFVIVMFLFISLRIVSYPLFFQAVLSVVARLAGWYGLDWVFIWKYCFLSLLTNAWKYFQPCWLPSVLKSLHIVVVYPAWIWFWRRDTISQ